MRARFPIVKQGGYEKETEKVQMNSMMLDWNQRCQCELVLYIHTFIYTHSFSLPNGRYVYVHGLVHISVFPHSFLWEGLKVMTLVATSRLLSA